MHLALLDNKKKKENSDNIKLKLINEYYFNTKLQRLCRDNKEVFLSKNGHKFMEILAKSKNTTVSNEQICGHIWHENRSCNTLRALVHRIREKTDTHLIENVKGMGYITYSK
nr:winged helix-turn-helix domain-containing protein [Sulfurovum sp. bin170]